MKIKIIDITALEWRDKINGNSYFSAEILVNPGLKTEWKIILPFQYGYDNQYLHEAYKALIDQKLINPKKDYGYLELFCQSNGVTLLYRKIENCLKRELHK